MTRIVGEVMTREVVEAYPGTPFKELVRLLDRHRISGLPVVEYPEQVAAGGDADQTVLLVHDGEALDAVSLHHPGGVPYALFRMHGDRGRRHQLRRRGRAGHRVCTACGAARPGEPETPCRVVRGPGRVAAVQIGPGDHSHDLVVVIPDPRGVELPDGASVFLCGPLPFMRDVRGRLLSAGVPARRIRYEVFGPDLLLPGTAV
jgi:hypothetical protein